MSITRKGMLLETAAIGIMLAIANTAGGTELSRDFQPHVAIRVNLIAMVPCLTLLDAQRITTTMLADAGVRLDWAVGRANNEAARIIVLEITSRQPAAFHRGA